jgi:hypothetical protein
MSLQATTTLKLRGEAKDFLSFRVGDGRKIFLWFDSWHPAGYLFDQYGYRTVYDAGSAIGLSSLPLLGMENGIDQVLARTT